MPEQKPPYAIAQEVRNGDLDTIREICSRIQLNSDVCRFRIEIESEAPILPEEMPDGKPETESKNESSNGFEKFEDTGTKVLSHTEEKDPSAGTFKIGTNPWKVAAFLFRQNEPLRLGHIELYLEGTKWEIGYKSLSATLSNLKSDGFVEKENIQNSSYDGYILSEKGEQRMQNTIEEADSYPLTVADKIAGLHPSNNYPQPDLEA